MMSDFLLSRLVCLRLAERLLHRRPPLCIYSGKIPIGSRLQLCRSQVADLMTRFNKLAGIWREFQLHLCFRPCVCPLHLEKWRSVARSEGQHQACLMFIQILESLGCLSATSLYLHVEPRTVMHSWLRLPA